MNAYFVYRSAKVEWYKKQILNAHIQDKTTKAGKQQKGCRNKGSKNEAHVRCSFLLPDELSDTKWTHFWTLRLLFGYCLLYDNAAADKRLRRSVSHYKWACMRSCSQLFNTLIAFLYLSVSAARTDLGAGNGKFSERSEWNWNCFLIFFLLHHSGSTVLNPRSMPCISVLRATWKKDSGKQCSRGWNKFNKNLLQCHSGVYETVNGCIMDCLSTIMCSVHAPISCALLQPIRKHQ